MNRLLSRMAIGVACALGAMTGAMAQATDEATRARSAAECELFADIAIVARALVEVRIDEKQQRPVLEAIYKPNNERAKFVVDSILGAARRTETPALPWAGELGKQCMQRDGRINDFLGTPL